MGRGRGTGQVVDFVDLGIIGSGHVVTDQLEVMTVQQLPDIILATGKIVIQTNHIIAFSDKTRTEMGTDKAGASRY